jgi:hypothetical protein
VIVRNYVLLIVLVLLGATPAEADGPNRWTLELTLGDQKIEGTPLAWNKREVRLLGRDGRLWQFAPSEPKDFRKTSDRFRGYSASELRAMLARELGREFEVSATAHYVVAHPQGKRDEWAGRFEDLYRSFVHYFRVRGFDLDEPPYPLVGIVCRNRREFQEYSASQGLPARAGVVGYYWLQTNRILVYDVATEAGDSASWKQSASIVIHEITHQTAFNTGVHSRFTSPPLWLAEGLATMFEAPGVYDSRSYTGRGDRVNRGRLYHFNQLVVPEHRPELLADLIASDRLFRSNPSVAYATAWALTFYLVETQPAQYSEYVALTADRPPFRTYTAAERTADFTGVFGDDWRMLEARFLRFMKGVK